MQCSSEICPWASSACHLCVGGGRWGKRRWRTREGVAGYRLVGWTANIVVRLRRKKRRKFKHEVRLDSKRVGSKNQLVSALGGEYRGITGELWTAGHRYWAPGEFRYAWQWTQRMPWWFWKDFKVLEVSVCRCAARLLQLVLGGHIIATLLRDVFHLEHVNTGTQSLNCWAV